jgi:arylsulfatase
MAAVPLALVPTAQAQAPAKKPNIVVIFGDDIGQSNISAYFMGVMGYKTPNIDRLAKDGVMFTDYYAEQSWTAGAVDVHHGPGDSAHRAVQSGHSGRYGGLAEG